MFFRFVGIMTVILLPLASCSSPGGVYHTVLPGQTLYGISQVYAVDERYLARLNGIDDPSLLRIGQRLFIPGTEKARQVPVRHPPASPLSAPPKAIQSRPDSPPARTRQSVPSPAAVVPVAPERQARKGIFVWPLKGTVLRSFGRSGNQACSGLEIGSPGGTAVIAAAAGRVTYSGNGIRGYGNLIIIRHDNSFFTVYGFNRKNLVEAGSFVSQGEKIALSGQPPDGGAPRLHFEIRHGKTAVDPIFYLP